MKIDQIKSSDFEEKVLKSDKLVIVDLWAEWCHPCKLIEPFIFEAAQRQPDKVKLFRLNVDNHPEVPSRYRVTSIPTVLFFRKGKEVRRIVGAMPKREYIKQVEELVREIEE